MDRLSAGASCGAKGDSSVTTVHINRPQGYRFAHGGTCLDCGKRTWFIGVYLKASYGPPPPSKIIHWIVTWPAALDTI